MQSTARLSSLSVCPRCSNGVCKASLEFRAAAGCHPLPRRSVGLRSMPFAFLEFTGGVREQIYWQAVSRREFISLGFRSLLSNLAAWFRLKHVGAQLDCKTPNPTTGFVSGSFFPPLVRPTIWLISKGPAVVRLPDVSAAEILLAGHLNIRQQKLDDQAELRNNESRLIRSSKVAFLSSSYLRYL